MDILAVVWYDPVVRHVRESGEKQMEEQSNERVLANRVFENRRFIDETFVEYEVSDCLFQDCVWESCTLTKCVLTGCRFVGCTIVSPQFEHSRVRQLEFDGCNLVGVRWHEAVTPGRAARPLRQVRGSLLKYNLFLDLPLVRFRFDGNAFPHTTFDGCDLRESGFVGCDLRQTQFFRSDLRRADFRSAEGYEIDLFTNKLAQARFSFPEAIRLLGSLDIRLDE